MSSKIISNMIIICLVIAFSGVIVSAESSAESPLNLPVILYGNVNIDGKPAPAGTIISAKADGSLAGTTIIHTPGTYSENDELPVSASSDGAIVDFYVNNIKATTSTIITYNSNDAGNGKHFRVDLNVQSTNVDSPGNGGGSGGGGNVTKTGTATPTASQIGVSARESVSSAQTVEKTTGKPDTPGSAPFQFYTILGIFVLLVIGAIIISVLKKGGKI